MKPNVFVVLGMPRAGTTFLFHTLGLHPGIFMPYRKESLFFSVHYEKGLDWYSSLYDGMEDGQVGADVNPLYYLDPDSLDKILDYDPEMRVILSVRDPLSFAVSQYGNILAMGWDAPPITQWIEGYDWKLSGDAFVPVRLVDGFMQRRVEEIRQRFAGKLLMYSFDHFQSDPLPVLREIEDFLGLDAFYSEDNFENKKINASGRRNLGFLNKLLTHQGFLETLYRLLPDSAIRQGRSLFDRLSVSGSKTAEEKPAIASEEEMAILSEKLASDSEWYQQLFRDQKVQRP